MGSHVQLVPFLRQLGCGSNPVLSRPTPHQPLVTYPFVAACCYIPLSQVLGTGMPQAKGLSQECLSQARIFCLIMSRNRRPSLLETQRFLFTAIWPRHNCKHNAWPLGQAQRRFRLRHCQASTEGKACREPLTRPACGSAKRQAPPGSRQPANHRRALKSAYHITILIWHEITDYSDYCNAKQAVCRSPSQCVARWLVHHSDHARRVILRRKESDFGNFCMLQHAGP